MRLFLKSTRRHLQSRPGFALEPHPHGVDAAQRFGAADRCNRAIEHRARLRLRALRNRFRIGPIRMRRRRRDQEQRDHSSQHDSNPR
jgi:hypothetical protein